MQILLKALKKGKIEVGVAYFPFRHLGTTIQYIEDNIPNNMTFEF